MTDEDVARLATKWCVICGVLGAAPECAACAEMFVDDDEGDDDGSNHDPGDEDRRPVP
jgi:hypothetical protein